MPDERAPWEQASPTAGYGDRPDDLAELRELILGPERRKLEELERRLEAAGVTREELAELLPEAIALRSGRDRQLGRALAPTVESAIGESVRRNPRPIATAIFPVLGPAIRKAIAEALTGLVASINRTLEHSLSPRGLRWRLEAWRTGVPYAQIVLRHALVYRVEQVFLIHARHRPAPVPRLGPGPPRERRRPHLRHAHRDPRLRGRLLRPGARGRRAPAILRGRADGDGRAGPAGADRGRGPRRGPGGPADPAAGHPRDDPPPARGPARRVRRRHGAVRGRAAAARGVSRDGGRDRPAAGGADRGAPGCHGRSRRPCCY